MKIILRVLLAILISALLIWHIFFTESVIMATIKTIIPLDYSVVLKGFKKGIFLSYYGEQISLLHQEKEFFKIQYINIDIDLLSLSINFKGRIDNGSINGNIKLSKDFNIYLKNIDSNSINILKTIGIRGSGKINGELLSPNRFLFWINNASFEDMFLNNSYIPLSMFSDIKGVLILKDQGIVIDSLTLEGNNGYGKISGDIISGNANLKLEIIPNKNDLIILNILQQYKTSDNHYVIMINEKLTK